ncbi:MAG TPA: type II secretion system F family protein [Natronosporangium sp.]|nr:type II secretion system F family protein [Natronosporangium sp.]
MITAAVAAGGAFGLGLSLLIWQVLPGTPAVRQALRRLHPEGLGPRSDRATPAWWRAWWRPPLRELRLLRRTRRQYAVTIGTCALIGLAVPALLGAMAATAGWRLPFAIPVVASLAVAAGFAWLAHRDVLARAARARYEFRRAVCSYLDLVSLELAAGHGPVAALERAATDVDAWVFERLREALLRAQLQLHQPWDELRTLAAAIDVPELGDVGDIVHAAGADGAVVQETLLARADSLRDQIRVEALARAKATTAKLDIPGAALLLVLAVFVIYPLLSRVG